MKKVIIVSIVAVSVMGAFAYIGAPKNEQVTHIEPQISKVVVEEPVVEPTPAPIVEETVVIPVVETVIPQKSELELRKEKDGMSEMTDYAYLMLKYLITNPHVYTYTHTYLTVTYPEKFTSENLEATLKYIHDNYINYKPNTSDPHIHRHFHW
jgi:hypothetical protein